MSPLPAILQRVENAGHAVFTRGTFNLNIVVVRTKGRKAGSFDDWLYIVYRDAFGWCVRRWQVTADPGAYYSENPLNRKGTARIAAGQYRGAWKVGKHKGYPALEQHRPVKVHRDNNRDNMLDDGVIDEGVFKVNVHASDLDPFDASDRNRKSVGRWSAGCVVFRSSYEYREEYWPLILRAAGIFGDEFTITFLED